LGERCAQRHARALPCSMHAAWTPSYGSCTGLMTGSNLQTARLLRSLSNTGRRLFLIVSSPTSAAATSMDQAADSMAGVGGQEDITTDDLSADLHSGGQRCVSATCCSDEMCRHHLLLRRDAPPPPAAAWRGSESLHRGPPPQPAAAASASRRSHAHA
jgi:hypothetical protein